MPVSEGDTILVSVANLDHQKETPIDVAWSQGLAPVTEKYIQTTFTITTAKDGGKTGAETEGIIFVQLNMLDAFKNKKVAEQPELTIVVDKDFVYGQKSADGTARWLVYHNKKHTPFQHRFITGLIKGALEKAAGIAKMLGFESGENLIKDVSKFFGNELHTF